MATLIFYKDIAPLHIVENYQLYTKRHPRYKLFRNKTIGAALIDFDKIDTQQKYCSLVKKNCLYHVKHARARGFRFVEIDRNSYVEEIYMINRSCASRQGRPMDLAYQIKVNYYDPLPHFRYFGIINNDNTLVAYANMGLFGNFYGLSQLIGLRNNDGIMHLLLFEIISRIIDQKEVRYVMYDTFFGALPGLRKFKTMLGFRPYRVKYNLL